VSGVLATVRLMFTALCLQRWLLRAGALLALIGAAGMIAGALGGPRWWTPIAILGSCLLLAPSPPFVGAVLLQSLGTSRAIRLIPHGRLQLLLGSFCAQILVALIGAAAVATIVIHSGNPHIHDRASAAAAASAGMFVTTFAIATFTLVTLYYASALRRGFIVLIVYIIAMRLLPVAFPNWAFPNWQLRGFLTSASALALTFIGTLSLWALFARGYLSAGGIGAPALCRGDGLLMRWLEGASERALIAPSERYATRVLLTGRRLGRRVTRFVVALGGAALFCYCLSLWRGIPVLNSEVERFFAVMIAYAGGMMATAAIQPMVGRSRYLWLRTRLDRGQLFRRAEAESWRMLLSVGVFALAISACVCLLARVRWAILTETLLLSFMCCIAMIYVMLLSTRKWPILHGLLVAALAGLWFFGLFYGLLQRDFAVSGLRLLTLLAPVLVLIPLLRIWARSRWTRLDWVINRPLSARNGV